MITHQTLARRSLYAFRSPKLPYYEELLRDNADVFLAGAAFADWGYVCGNQEAAEAAHWPDFLNHAALYVRQMYPRPWNKTAEGLVSFLMGMTTHYLSDMTWHSLKGLKEGFITTLSRISFKGDWDAAHGLADIGGDAVARYLFHHESLPRLWHVPAQHIKAIYARQNLSSSSSIMKDCFFMMNTAAQLELLGIERAFATVVAKSHFMADQMRDYFLGGLDDMVAWVQKTMLQYTATLETGLLLELPRASFLRKRRTDRVNEAALKSIVKTQFEVAHRIATTVKPLDRESMVHLLDGLPGLKQNFPFPGLPSEHLNDDDVASAESASSMMSSNGWSMARMDPGDGVTFDPFGYYGRSIAAGRLSSPDCDDLVVGAPGTDGQKGRVYVWSCNDGNLKQSFSGKPLVLAAEDDEYGRFGWDVVVVDLNADGINDLVVSAPVFGGLDMLYTGRVYIFLGEMSGSAVRLPSRASFVLEGPSRNWNLGHVLYSADIDGDGCRDLIIGSLYASESEDGLIQNGHAAVFLSSRFKSKMRDARYLSVGDADWSAAGSTGYEHFGAAFVYVDRGPDSLLLVGSPDHKTGSSLHSAGCIYGYSVASLLEAKFSKEAFRIQGTSVGDGLGASFAYSRSLGIVAIGGNNGRSALKFNTPNGRVTLVHQSELVNLRGSTYLSELVAVQTLQGSTLYGSFGTSLAFVDLNGDGSDEIVIGERLSSSNSSPAAGAVSVWISRNDTETNRMRYERCYRHPYVAQRAQFGSRVVPLVLASRKRAVAIAAPYESTADVPEHGSLSILFSSR